MEARQVRHFLAAYDGGTFAAAGERLGLTQQAVSKSILRLEAQLGVRLFERDGRRVRPTPYADLFVPHARTIAAETDRFRADLSDMLGGRHGRLHVGVGPSAAADIVATAVTQLTAKMPQIRLGVLAGIYQRMVEDLILGKLDVVIALRQVDRVDPLVREELLGEVRYIVVAGTNHRLAGQPNVQLADLLGSRWLVGTDIGAVERSIEASFRAAGVRRFRPEIETTSVQFTLAMLDSGEHLAILPEMMVAREMARGRFVRIDVDADWSRPLIVATRIRGPKSVLIGALVDELRAAMPAR